MIAYAFGLLILWIRHKGRKSFSKLVREYEWHEVRVAWASFGLNLFAGIGAIMMIVVVLFMLSLVIWMGIKYLLY